MRSEIGRFGAEPARMDGMSLSPFELPDLETVELEPDGETLRVWLNRPACRTPLRC